MRITTILTGGLVSLALAGTAIAAPPQSLRGDLDKNGEVTLAEVNTRLDQRFRAIDTNGNGQIEQAEMQAAREQHRAKRAERREARGAEMADKRGGERRGGKRGEGRGKIDANGDGVITRAEFGARALARFERADANKDGVVTAEERAAMREARKARRG
ncbi:EF-hand domain-containing protein [Porphyrobacter sp. YT40]|uniref:EF-hand domain-containing protein n=1 Tax=Porphyrobacter sp. YT40 TaxID=2547601 RepID=UPI001143678E|nr:EF-hand domain-containing protein [Porphyrobacter sp. YT40]QDH35994.1 hypothetical protein E2E27_00375 [Porphyrobacter sp. YT40]